MATTPPTDDQGGPDPGPEGPATELDGAAVAPDDPAAGSTADGDDDLDDDLRDDLDDDLDDDGDDDLDEEPESPATPISVADLLRREGYDPDPDLEWEAEPAREEPPTDVIASGPSRWRRVLVGAGSALALGSVAAAAVLLLGTAGDDAPPPPAEPRPGTAAPHLAPLPSTSGPAAPTSEPADEEPPAAPAAVLAPVLVQVPADPDPVVPPPAEDTAQPSDDDAEEPADSGDDPSGDDQERSGSSAEGDADDDSAEEPADDPADDDESTTPPRRPSGNPLTDIVDGLGGALGPNR
ncbi:hypothetical protein [Pseudonocardia humida]|uniref:Uncharacterized protein n=1 Tax=Pseudonocardia humida TaxID=2800819 RepID=A0ABT0ZW06_9PSEU|nr:hypothetical protein [Pseudonocardia humida]MCO1654896.1 hypothetical protein [Pseudonocardia humida]